MDHYELLGVPRDATPAQISEAYVARAKRAHPDLHQHRSAEVREAATRQMAALNEAARVLRDPELRGGYDAAITTPASPTRPSHDPAGTRSTSHRQRARPRSHPARERRRRPRWGTRAVLAFMGVVLVGAAYDAATDDEHAFERGDCMTQQAEKVPCADDTLNVVSIETSADRCATSAPLYFVDRDDASRVYCLQVVDPVAGLPAGTTAP